MSPWLSDLFLSSQSDERLVCLARDGHQQAFTVIVQRYRRELTRLANRLCSDGRGEDVVQQALLTAFAALRNGTEVRHLRGWLYSILRHHAARTAQRSAPGGELAEVASGGEALEEAVGQRMFAIDTLSQINRLPDRQRTALVATAIEGRSRAEVAGLLGLSEGAVRQLVHRARSAVRTAVTAITPFPLLRWSVSRQPRSADWSTPELLAGAGAGGASAAAAAVKIGVVVVAGLGATAAIVVPHRTSHRHPRAASVASSGHSSAAQATGGLRPPEGSTAISADGRGPSVFGTLAGVGAAASIGLASPSLRTSFSSAQHDGGGRVPSQDDHGGPTRAGSGGSDGGRGGSDGGSGGGGSSSVVSGGDSSPTSGTSDGGGTPSGHDGGSSSDGGSLSSATSGSSDGGGGTLTSGSDGGMLSSSTGSGHDSGAGSSGGGG